MFKGEFFHTTPADGAFYSHQIEQSVRFDDGSSSYLSRTHSGTATNEDVGLISFWFKRFAWKTPKKLLSVSTVSLICF